VWNCECFWSVIGRSVYGSCLVEVVLLNQVRISCILFFRSASNLDNQPISSFPMGAISIDVITLVLRIPRESGKAPSPLSRIRNPTYSALLSLFLP
jgi:hypothetical protein